MPEIIISIIANGEKTDPFILKRYTEDSHLIIAADGGLQNCYDAQIQPDYLVGDLDSYDKKLLCEFPALKTKQISDQDTTDLEKTIGFAMGFRPTQIRFFAIFGLRSDHTFANMILLQNFSNKYKVEVYDNYGKMVLFHPGKHIIKGKIGKTVSFFSFNAVKNLTIEGFKYPLKGHTDLRAFFGISNVYSSHSCKVSLSEGAILMYELY
jgi:thiamine pyrophosphokinase